jgi:hypothetical protein
MGRPEKLGSRRTRKETKKGGKRRFVCSQSMAVLSSPSRTDRKEQNTEEVAKEQPKLEPTLRKGRVKAWSLCLCSCRGG